MNKRAERAQIVSDEVAAVSVRKTGESDMRARNIKIDDFRALRSGGRRV
jgi:hypothetical protein